MSAPAELPPLVAEQWGYSLTRDVMAFYKWRKLESDFPGNIQIGDLIFCEFETKIRVDNSTIFLSVDPDIRYGVSIEIFYANRPNSKTSLYRHKSVLHEYTRGVRRLPLNKHFSEPLPLP